MEHESSLPGSHKPEVGHYPKAKFLKPCFCKIDINNNLTFTNVIFISVYPTKIVHAFIIIPLRSTCSTTNHPSFDNVAQLLGEGYKLWSFFLAYIFTNLWKLAHRKKQNILFFFFVLKFRS
jgi:hypothetical protein